MPGKFLGIVGHDPSDSKSNQLYVVIFWFFFIESRVYSLNSSQMMGNRPGKFLGIVGQDPSDSKSNQLLAIIFWFFFIESRVSSLDSSQMMDNSARKVFEHSWSRS